PAIVVTITCSSCTPFSHLFNGASAEQALGAYNQDHCEQEIGDQISITGCDIARYHRLDHSEEQPTNHCAGQVAQAPNNCSHKTFNAQTIAYGGIDVDHWRDQQTGSGSQPC